MKLHPIEQSVIDYIEFDYSNPIIFDVGAHYGAFALACKEKWPSAQITCFEANPNTAKTLKENVGDFAQIVSTALSDDYHASQELFTDGAEDMTASFYKRDLSYLGMDHGTQSIKIHTEKLSKYVEKSHQIDYLKIDVEGHEFYVLIGAENYLVPEIIKNIQLEYNSCMLESRIFFRDFWRLLHPRGYEISISDKFQAITEYNPILEDFSGHREILARNPNQ